MNNPFGNILEQVQKTQEALQQALSSVKVTGEAGAGLVSVVLNGHGDALETRIDDSLLKEDKQVLQDLITAAINSANSKKKTAVESIKKDKLQDQFSQFGIPADMLNNMPFMKE